MYKRHKIKIKNMEITKNFINFPNNKEIKRTPRINRE